MSDPGSLSDRQDLLAAELAEHYLIEEELGRVRLTVQVLGSYIGLMRPETRRNRNPLSIDHAFT